jgi:hypothetical protein
VALKELNETALWLQIIGKSRMIRPELLGDLTRENQELTRIIDLRLLRNLPKSRAGWHAAGARIAKRSGLKHP